MKKFITLIALMSAMGVTETFLGESLYLTIFYFVLLLCIACAMRMFLFRFNEVNALTLSLVAYSVIFPIYASIKSNMIFGQPFFVGLASLRYMCFVFFGLFLYQVQYDYMTLLKQVNILNVLVALVSIVAYFIFGYYSSTDLRIRGSRLTLCSGLMMISYVYYLINFIKTPAKRSILIPFVILVIYLVFVNKGRQPLAVMAVVYCIYYIRSEKKSVKSIMMAVLPAVVVILLCIYESSFIERFTTVLDVDKSKDFSTLARIKSMEAVWSYIKDNYMLGIGNLSARFGDEGFHQIFGAQFYISDIGVVGTLARGGVVLLLIYFLIYTNIYKRIKYVYDKEIRTYMYYMLLTFIVMLIVLSNDILFSDGSMLLAVMYYPLFASKRKKSITV